VWCIPEVVVPVALVGGGSGCTSRKGGIGRKSYGEAAAVRLGEGSSAPRLAGPAAKCRDSKAAATVRSEAAGERIKMIGRGTSE
jgi:hypothetical protein